MVPGQPKKSLLVAALKHDGLKMPPKAKLPASIVADFEKWIQLGAPDPRDGKAVATQAIESRPARPTGHSSRWQKPSRRQSPMETWFEPTSTGSSALPKEPRGSPQPPGDSGRAAPRVHFNMIGLPPTPDDQQRFLAEAEKDFGAAWAAEIDRLLASQHYGERWGRHWLDLVRFAESNGYAFDKDRAKPTSTGLRHPRAQPGHALRPVRPPADRR
ncbi:MAG: hypothetical protein Ct9H300mP1_16780 [Planctomycetaceae bacterium]|nr:MAG: hypothetical protein Ct9H300mP1_16780 [Planctomycetaceae bacterium]